MEGREEQGEWYVCGFVLCAWVCVCVCLCLWVCGVGEEEREGRDEGEESSVTVIGTLTVVVNFSLTLL